MFGQDFSGPALLEDARAGLPVRGCHPLWPAIPDGSGSNAHATGLVRVRSPLLAESLLMSFPPATEMFQFAGFASALPPIPQNAGGCPIRRSSDQRVLPPPRSLSQGATSFIASRCQGIHQMPFSSLESPRSSIRKHTPHLQPKADGRSVRKTICSQIHTVRSVSGIGRQGSGIGRSHPSSGSETKQTHKGDPSGCAQGRNPNGPPSSSSRCQEQKTGVGYQGSADPISLSSSQITKPISPQ